MMVQTSRAKYEVPRLEVQQLRDLPSALATSGHGGGGCKMTPSKHTISCSTTPDRVQKRN